ncbi:hypothetical protein KUV80_02600 [Fictibacillus nanhaiensis]|uniref:hypothetical protein n=1 Tax=Fictibacillus nanhaiensis TaxID=742169 RepID=UPI001C9655C8|nr:hypothetical protein [Fictibacillus nanhaiensis]MBY6035519.1 hypothetical protein [Fictibacillus nanhaiensis]
MLRNNKGYLLVESMFGLVLFSAVIGTCLPYIHLLYQEKKTTRQILYAIEEVDHVVAQYSIGMSIDNKEWEEHGTNYTLLTKKGAADENELCISFEGSNEKSYKMCAGYL